MAPVTFTRLATLIDASDVIDRTSPHGDVAHPASVKLRMFDATGTIEAGDVDDAIVLKAPLPQGPGIFELMFQARGIQSRLKQLSEQKIGVAALDAAFLVRCDDEGFSLLQRVSTALQGMLPCPPHGRIHVDNGHLTVVWSADRLNDVVHLWERLHAVRIGA